MKLAHSVLITGVAGFIGRYVARQFANEGWRVVGVDQAPSDTVSLRPGSSYHQMLLPDSTFGYLLAAERPQVCVHCAGRASVPFSMEEPAADFRDSVGLTFEVLDALRLHARGCRFLLLSSAAVYGNPESLPVSEVHAVAPVSPYGYHKRQCELICEEFSSVFAMQTASVRVFSAYGPGLRRQVVWDICERVLNGRELTLHGTGAESRDFIHAADVARALALLSREAKFEAEAYNLATGREVTIRELASLVASVLRPDLRAVFDGKNRPGDPANWRADVSRIERLGFVPTVTLEQGIRTVATWASAELAAK